MRYEKEDILDKQFPAGYAPNYSASPHPLGFSWLNDAKCTTTFEGPEEYNREDYEGALDEEEELENEPSPEPWEEQVRLWGMYPNE